MSANCNNPQSRKYKSPRIIVHEIHACLSATCKLFRFSEHSRSSYLTSFSSRFNVQLFYLIQCNFMYYLWNTINSKNTSYVNIKLYNIEIFRISFIEWNRRSLKSNYPCRWCTDIGRKVFSSYSEEEFSVLSAIINANNTAKCDY